MVGSSAKPENRCVQSARLTTCVCFTRMEKVNDFKAFFEGGKKVVFKILIAFAETDRIDWQNFPDLLRLILADRKSFVQSYADHP